VRRGGSRRGEEVPPIRVLASGSSVAVTSKRLQAIATHADVRVPAHPPSKSHLFRRTQDWGRTGERQCKNVGTPPQLISGEAGRLPGRIAANKKR